MGQGGWGGARGKDTEWEDAAIFNLLHEVPAYCSMEHTPSGHIVSPFPTGGSLT